MPIYDSENLHIEDHIIQPTQATNIQLPRTVTLCKKQGHYIQFDSKTQVSVTLKEKYSSTKQNAKKLEFSETNSSNDGQEPLIQKKVKYNDELYRKVSNSISTSTNDTFSHNCSPASTNYTSEEEKDFDGEDFLLDNFYEMEEKEDENQVIMEQINSIINKNNASININDQIVSENTTFGCQCFLGHFWETSLKQLQSGHWCQKCNQQLEKARIYAQKNQGVVLNDVFQHKIQFQCQKNHQWSFSYRTYSKNQWCHHCRKDAKEEVIQALRDIEVDQVNEYAMQQQELFNEAKIKSEHNNF